MTQIVAGYPVVGIMPDMLINPVRTLCRLAYESRGSVVQARLGPATIYLLTRPEHVAHVLAEAWRDFPKGDQMWRPIRKLLGQGLVTIEGEAWIRNRRLMQPLFSQKNLAALASTMVSTIDHSLDALARRTGAGMPVDIEREMVVVTQNVVLETVFGAAIGRSEAETLATALVEAFRSINLRMMLFFVPERLPLPGDGAFRRALLRFDEAMFRLVRERRAGGDETRKDLLSLLLAARDPDTHAPIGDRQIRDELVTLFIAGNETTALTMTWTMYLLAQHPEIEARVRTEVEEALGGRAPTSDDLQRLPYSKRVIQEAMRLYPPAWILPRVAAADEEIDGCRIPAGSTVIASQYVMHHDPTLWDRPEEFDPDRFLPDRVEARPRCAYMPFGAGPRFCIGEAFSLMEAQFILAMMLQRFRTRLVPGQRIEPKATTTLRPRNGVRMICSPC